MRTWFEKITKLIYSNICLICSSTTENNFVCKTCENDFIERKGHCIKELNPITVYSWGFYSGKLRDGILKLKSGKRNLAKYFSKKIFLLWHMVPKKFKNKNVLVIPVPSHKRRIKERGYCQSAQIAREVAQKISKDFSKSFIIRIKETMYMNELNNINERKENIKGAFKLNKSLDSYDAILIIDDIVTSGNTLSEMARTIKKKYPDIQMIAMTIASGDVYI